MTSDNPMLRQIGGGHYKHLKIEPAEFWIRNQFPGAEGAAIKYLTRHRFKNGREDIGKARHFVEMMIHWYFDAPVDERAIPVHWRGQHNFAIRPETYCNQNQLPPEETAAVMLICDFTCREHLTIVLDAIDQILQRDYSVSGYGVTLERRDVLYLAKEHLQRYVNLLRVARKPTDAVMRIIDAIDQEWRGGAR